MEEGEVFDSSMLKESINTLIASGKRNFAIDMSPLDYIYSDTINMLMALNKRVLDVTGRLSLMAPQPEVTQILKRAGIHNILRIFETETELIKSSEDMILQTTSIKMSDVNAALKQAPPQSEFDQLRSEIGSVFGAAESAAPAMQPQAASAAPQGRAGGEDEFDQMFQQFESSPQISNRGQIKPPSIQPQIQQPSTPQPQPPRFQPRQFKQPPVQPIPLRPAAPAHPRQPMEIPKFNADFSSVRSETQRFTTAPGAVPYQEQRYQPPAQHEKFTPVEEEEAFEAPNKMKPDRKSRLRDSFDSFDDEEVHDEEFKKKSPIPILVIILLIIALGGAGAFIINMTLGKNKPAPVAAVTPPAVAPATPQIPVEAPKVEQAEPAAQDQKPAEAEEEKEIVESKPETRPPVQKATPKPAVRKSTPPPPKPAVQQASKPQPAVKNQVVINSYPSGASVTINGQRMGTTPFTWSKPFFGKVSVQLSKNGYKDADKSFEFTGGSISESISLEKEVAPPPPPPEQKKPIQREEPKPIVQSPPKKAPPPPTSEEEIDDPFSDIGEEDDDFTFESEPEAAKPRTSAPVAKTTPAAPPARTPTAPPASRSGGGGEALIFIASIPPVADVYLGDQLIGKTNVSELKIPAGVQTLKFVKGGKEITKQLNLQAGKNPSQMVRIP